MSKKILLVEDSAPIAMHEAQMLKKHGYEVVNAYKGEKAVEIVDNDPEISLIIMDIDLGKGIDGTEAAERILSRHELPIIFLTSHSEKEYVDRVKEITNYGYVLKNSGEFVLIESINMAFNLYETNRELQRQKNNLQTAIFNQEKTKEAYQRIFDLTPALICVAGIDGYFKELNPEWEKTLGYTIEELKSWPLKDFIHPDDVEPTQREIEKQIQGGKTANFINRYRHKNGTYRYLEWNAKPSGQGHLYASARDITAQIQSEEETKNREEDLRTTLNSIGDAVISTDIAGKIERMNPVAENLTGWAIDAAKGRKLDEIFHIINAYTRKPVDNPVEKVIQTNETFGLPDHTVLISKEGTKYQIADSASPIRGDDGNINGVVLVFRDVTDEYEKEWQLRERVKELDCLYKIAQIVEQPDISVNTILQQTAEAIPHSWQYPKTCECKITLHEDCFQTNNFSDTKWKLSSDIAVEGEVAGKVEVCYIEEKPTIDEGPFSKEERKLIDAIAERLGRIIERKQNEEKLRSIEWMLSNKSSKEKDYVPEYGDVSELNSDGLIISSVGKEQLRGIASEYLDLLESSTAIYEKNGDYALGIFTSGWCQLMDSASRRICNTEDNQEALESGKWLCHESCWEDAALAMEKDRPVEIECHGGIKMYAVPIHANGEIVGAMNFGYGNPPTDESELKKLANRYNIPIHELKKQAEAYKHRPQFIIDYAKERIQTAAETLGYLIERKQTEKALKREQFFLSSVLDNIKEAIIICNEKGEIIRFNGSARRLHQLPEKRIPAEQWAEYYDLYYPDGRTTLATKDIPLFRALQGEDVYNVEIIVKPKKDASRLLSCSGQQVKDENGKKSGAVIAMHDITEYKKVIEEKDYLMKELNHRVKNNLAMVSSLISLKDLEIDNDLSDLKHRIDIIKLVHEKLHQHNDTEHIEVKEYFQELLEAIFYSSSRQSVQIINKVEDVSIPTKSAIPLGLIVNEIATNAVKYGFTDHQEARFSVDMRKDYDGKHYILILSNTGNPFPEEVGLENPETMGLQLISTLVAQLKGTIELQKTPNPVFTIRFPVED